MVSYSDPEKIKATPSGVATHRLETTGLGGPTVTSCGWHCVREVFTEPRCPCENNALARLRSRVARNFRE